MAMTVDAPGQQMEMSGTGVMTGDNSLMHLEFDYAENGGEPDPMEMIAADGVGYVASPVLDDVLPPGKRWLRVTGAEIEQQSMTPAQLVEMIRGEPDVEDAGDETIRGEPTTHLRAPIDPEELLERAPDGPITQRFADNPEALGEFDMVIDVWITADDHLRRITLEVTSGASRADVSVDILEEGVSIEGIEAPPASQVAAEDELQAR